MLQLHHFVHEATEPKHDRADENKSADNRHDINCRADNNPESVVVHTK